MCSAISKSSPSNRHPKSQEVRYKWAVLDIGRNSVSPWTTARTITCNKGITSRFPKSRVPCQVRWHNASKPHAVSRAGREMEPPLRGHRSHHTDRFHRLDWAQMKLTPVLIVEDKIGFAILQRQGAELMLQSIASVRKDAAAFAPDGDGAKGCGIFIEVEDFEDVRQRVARAPDVLRHARNRRPRAQRPHRDLRGENVRVTAVVPAQMVGRTPWSARVPPDPPPANEISAIRIAQADGGVGCLRHAG